MWPSTDEQGLRNNLPIASSVCQPHHLCMSSVSASDPRFVFPSGGRDQSQTHGRSRLRLLTQSNLLRRGTSTKNAPYPQG